MPEDPKTFADARAAAEAAVAQHQHDNPGQPLPGEGDGGVETQTEDGGTAASPGSEGEGEQQTNGAPSEQITITLKGGEEIQVTAEEQQRLLELGFEVGDEAILNDVRLLGEFAQKNPGAAKVMDRLMQHVAANPGQEEAILEQLGITKEAPETADPRDVEIADLKAKLAKQDGEKGRQSAHAQMKTLVKEKMAAYPALAAYSEEELVDRIEVRLHRGLTVQQAVNELVRAGVSRETERVTGRARVAKNARALRGTAGDGAGATSVSEPKQMSGDDLLSGKTRTAAQRFLRQGGR